MAVRMARKKMWVRHDKAARELGYAPGPARGALTRAVEWFQGEWVLLNMRWSTEVLLIAVVDCARPEIRGIVRHPKESRRQPLGAGG